VIRIPAPGDIYTQGEVVNVDYDCVAAGCQAWVDNDQTHLIADHGGLPTDVVGPHTFYVTDGTTTVHTDYTVAPPPDTTDPTAAIASPTEGAHYPLNAVVIARYSCSDEPGGSGLARCDGTVDNGAPVPTDVPGDQTFTVLAEDNAGNQANFDVHYTVDAPPSPTPPGGNVGELAGRLLARTHAGAVPNAPATDPAISHDGRVDRYVAYVSAASDIVTGSGDHRNVFLVSRAKPYGKNGTPWRVGRTVLASRGRSGAAANGDSWGPSLDGADSSKASCLAFVSDASNLVAADTDGRADAFLMRLGSRRLTRIAGSGAVSAVSVDGQCARIAFVAGGTLYVRNTAGGVATRVSAKGGVTDPLLSADGKSLSFARRGAVYGGPVGHGHKIGAGKNPSSDGFGRYVAFERGGRIVQGFVHGAPRVHAIANGSDPSMTSGGHFVFYAQGGDVRLNVKSKPVATCGSGTVTQVAGSPHGNYVAYACSTGEVLLGYVGPQ
jgi:hypothetical protein